jgi:carnitine-CoA ligase
VLADSEAVMAIADPERETLVAAALADCPALREVVVLRAPEPAGLDHFAGPTPSSLDELEIDPSAPANVYYTSGTTGPPKGCVVDHRYWLRFVSLYLELYGMAPSDRMLTCLSFFYNDPSWHLLLALRAGTAFVAMRRFSVSRFWEVVRRFEITQLFGIASIPSLLLTAEPRADDRDHAIRFAVQVGIPSPDVHRRLVERWGFPWLELYGLTETGIVTAVRPEEGLSSTGSGSIGTAVPRAELRIVDEEGLDVPSGAEGELLVRAPGLMLEYLNRPDATDEAMRGGFFHTGDLVRREGDGRLYFGGRIKDIVRRSGENVSAAEVEAVLTEHPAVLEAAVIPIADDLRGEEIKAHVLLRAGIGPEDVPPASLAAHCASRLASHKVPRFLEYRDEDFPRTPSMRVAKRALIESDREPRARAWDREEGSG